MYNGIGLRTAKGSATSGYVQRNTAYVRPEFFRSQVGNNKSEGGRRGRGYDDSHSSVNKRGKVSEEILQHNRKRAIEGKVYDHSENLKATGKYTEEEIEEKCQNLRESLNAEMDRDAEQRDIRSDGRERDRDKDRRNRSRSRSRSRDRDDRRWGGGEGRRGVCFDFQKGRCRRGGDCRFAHPLEGRDSHRRQGDGGGGGGEGERSDGSGWKRGNDMTTDTHEREKLKSQLNEKMRRELSV